MAVRNNSKSLRHNGHFSCMLMLLLAIWLYSVESMPTVKPNGCGYSANTESCEYGYFTMYLEPGNCLRTYCFIGPNKQCRPDDPTTRCMEGLNCYCGRCRRELMLCPQQKYMQTWRKRVQNDLLEYNV